MKEGVKRITTETGAGQWGSALSFACQMFDIECKVFMVRISYDQKPYRRIMMQTWGASVVPSPSTDTNAGRQILALRTRTARVAWESLFPRPWRMRRREKTRSIHWAACSTMCCLHQTVVGQEVIKQLEVAGADWPDVLVGCTGGGSNFGGFAFPFLRENITGGRNTRFVAVEPVGGAEPYAWRLRL